MKKQQEKHSLDEFEEYAHLWNIVPGGDGEGIVLLRKIVDSIHNNSFEILHKTPSFLIVGATGKKLVARALVNSLALEDIRICPGKFFDNGIYSYQFFFDSIASVAHIITDIEQIKGLPEATLWKYIASRECRYYNHADRSYSNILYCNGWIVLTCRDTDKINDALLSAIDYKIEIEELNRDQVLAAVHQRLVFCNVEYDGEEVIEAIVDAGNGIDQIMEFLKKCLMLMQAEMVDFLDMEIVRKVGRLSGAAVVDFQDDIPF